MDFDRILENVGTFGRIQKFHYILTCYPIILGAYYILPLEFIGKSPGYTCKDRPADNPCELQPPCEKFIYGTNFTSIITEWELVCEQERYAEYAQSVLMFGLLVGSCVLGQMCDMYGRKKILIGGFILLAIIQMISAFITSYRQFLITRFITGFLCGNVAFSVLILETTHKSLRATLSNFGACFFSVGVAIVALTAYFVRDWRHFLILSNLPMLLFFIFCWLLPESPRWLVSKGRITEAEDIMLDIAHKNGISLPRTMVSMAEEKPVKGKEQTTKSIIDAFKTPELRKRTLILMFIWPVTCMTYYGLTLQAASLGGNMYINVVASGLIEIPGVLIAIYTSNRYGRKKTVFGCLILGGVTLFGVLLAPGNTGHSGSSHIQIALAMTGKMAISAVFSVIYTYTGELMPTVIRSSGIGSCSMVSRIGGIIAPLLTTLGDGISYTTYGITCLIAGAMLLSLPETMGKGMPESIDDVEASAIKKPAEYTAVSQQENT